MKEIEFHPLLSDRARLLILSTLAARKEAVDFGVLLEVLKLTKGNLSSHMRRLEDAELVTVEKYFVDRKPKTTYRCSALGRRAMKAHLKFIEQILSESLK